MEKKNSMLYNFAAKLGNSGVEKSDDELARERFEKEVNNSVAWWLAGSVWIGLIALITASVSIVSKNISTKIILGVISVILIVLLIFCVIKYIRQKNALEDVFESVLGGERSITNISATSGLTEKEVIRITQSLLSKGVIKNIYIDKLNHKIIEKQKSSDKSGNIGKVVLCSGCGAKNTLNGTIGQQCEYCGAVLHGN